MFQRDLFRPPRYKPAVRTAEFNYVIPPELIAQVPAKNRDHSRLLVFHRPNDTIDHHQFSEFLNFLQPGDLLVLNDSRVIPARLRGINTRTGGRFELLLLEENATNDWWVLLRPGKRAPLHTQIELQDHHGERTGILAIVIEINREGHRRLQFDRTKNIGHDLETLGEVPLPPYIKRTATRELTHDRHRYQTVYARADGSVAVPAAGLHFTNAILDQLRRAGVQVCFVTLHVGLGTFSPVKSELLAE